MLSISYGIFGTTYDITTRSRSSARDLLEEFIKGD